MSSKIPEVLRDPCFGSSRTELRASVAVLVAVGVGEDGKCEVLGVDVATGEDGAGWLVFVRGLVARGLTGVKLAVSDAHPGLRDALASALPSASWQRCRTHFMRNLLTRVPNSAQALVATIVRTVFAQPDQTSTRDQHRRVVDHLRQLGFGKAPISSPTAPRSCSRSPLSRRRTGARYGPTTRRNGSTRSCDDAPTSSASSRTASPSCGSRSRPRREARRLGRLPALHDHRPGQEHD